MLLRSRNPFLGYLDLILGIVAISFGTWWTNYFQSIGTFSPSKTFHIVMTQYSAGGSPIQCYTEKTKRLTHIISGAFQRMAILFKRFVLRDPQLLKRADIVYVGLILEFCSSV